MYPIFGQIELICICVYHVFTCQDMSSLYKIEFRGSSYSKIVMIFSVVSHRPHFPLSYSLGIINQ